MSSINISGDSVIKLILQFLLENGFEDTFFSLQKESNVYLNGVENLDEIENKVMTGSWGDLLFLIKYFKLPVNLLIIIFEHILLELLELKEPYLAKLLFENSEPLNKHLRILNPQRYEHFSEVIERSIEIIKHTSKNDTEKCEYSSIYKFVKANYMEDGDMINSRKRISSLLLGYIDELPRFKLLEIIGIALNRVNTNCDSGVINFVKDNDSYNIFNLGVCLNSRPSSEKKMESKNKIQKDDLISNEFIHSARINDTGEIKCISFSPDGEKLLAGTSKGYIFIGDCFENIFDKSHKNTTFYTHSNNKKAVLCLSTIRLKDSKLVNYITSNKDDFEKNFFIASTSENIDIKIWCSLSREFILSIENVHKNYITDFRFNGDGTCILSGSYDGSIKIHGLKSERTIKYFSNNNKSFVRKVVYNNSEKIAIGGLNNGCITIWDIKTSRQLALYSICDSPIIELSLIVNPEMVFSTQTNVGTSNIIQTFDKICVVSRFELFILNVLNGEKTCLTQKKKENDYIISASINSKENKAFTLDKNGIRSFDMLKKRYISNITIRNSNLEDGRIKVNSELGIIAIENKDYIYLVNT
ncbi:WD-40 repeat protein [Cryptosporidium ryanae]|uniref:WD-40 repeat protein n=1 Tax=Cryptosporidium ryanae TaxID=515981 RepID=UPI003519F762|nr:WD-40 repeat protein [Cryptosporidium ryanae]